MAIVMGAQLRGIQHNLEVSICGLCNLNVKETPHHILFKCEAEEYLIVRTTLWNRVTEKMPYALKQSVYHMTVEENSKLILTCLGGSFIKEWTELYTSISIFISKMYITRDIIYQRVTQKWFI